MRAGDSDPLAHVATDANGDAGLLGMALIDDDTAVVHYTTPLQTYHLVSRIDLRNGNETVVHQFVTDLTNPGGSVSSEHHGGNPIFAEGAIYFATGDFGSGRLASDPAST